MIFDHKTNYTNRGTFCKHFFAAEATGNFLNCHFERTVSDPSSVAVALCSAKLRKAELLLRRVEAKNLFSG